MERYEQIGNIAVILAISGILLLLLPVYGFVPNSLKIFIFQVIGLSNCIIAGILFGSE